MCHDTDNHSISYFARFVNIFSHFPLLGYIVLLTENSWLEMKMRGKQRLVFCFAPCYNKRNRYKPYRRIADNGKSARRSLFSFFCGTVILTKKHEDVRNVRIHYQGKNLLQ